jgi:hypothetical protein
MPKAISPFIAAVLVIGFVVAVTTIIYTFGTGLIAGLIRPVEPEVERLVEWAREYLEITDVYGNKILLYAPGAPEDYAIDRVDHLHPFGWSFLEVVDCLLYHLMRVGSNSK